MKTENEPENDIKLKLKTEHELKTEINEIH
jgi:hypothetical protein